MPLQQQQRHAKDASMTRVGVPAQRGQCRQRNNVWQSLLHCCHCHYCWVVFAVFSKAKKQLVLEFLGGLA
jgi:hypothetical protein